MTFRESNGSSGTISQVVGTVVRQPGGQTSANLPLPAGGTASATYAQTFDVSANVDAIVWRVTASGTDAHPSWGPSSI